MRQHKACAAENAFSILALDDDPLMTASVQAYFQRSGYRVEVENDPVRAIERVKQEHYDILLLDFLMTPICGDQVVEAIRKFDRELFIILLTGHKDMAPPLRTIRALDIQGYYEKSDRFDQLELLVESCVKSIRQLRTIRGYQNGLNAMMETLPGIYHLQTLEQLSSRVLGCITALTQSSGSILALDLTRCGVPGRSDRQFLLRTAGTQISEPEDDQLRQVLADVETSGQQIRDRQLLYPLNSGGQVIGFLGVETAAPAAYEQCQLLEMFTRQTSAALSNVLLHTLVQKQNSELDEAYSQLRSSYTEIIATVRSIVDAKDFYTRHHSDRVSFYSVELARALGKDEEYCERLRVAGLFHDIGKLGIPDGILLKEERLTPEEFAVIKTHSGRGAQLLTYISGFRDIIPWIRAHHERYDGTGYPDGLAGIAIPEQARIIAVADAFDAMTSDRRYRGSLGIHRAIEELRRGAGSQFDPEFARIFVRLASQPDFLARAAAADSRSDAPQKREGSEG